MEDCIFCKIAKGEIKTIKLWENEEFLAILDAFPVMVGQVLVIPKKHIGAYLFELNDEIYCKLLLIAKKIAKVMDLSLKPVKVGMIIEGLEVDHVHVKLFPFMDKKGFHMKTLEPKPSEEEMKEITEKIKENI